MGKPKMRYLEQNMPPFTHQDSSKHTLNINISVANSQGNNLVMNFGKAGAQTRTGSSMKDLHKLKRQERRLNPAGRSYKQFKVSQFRKSVATPDLGSTLTPQPNQTRFMIKS